MAYDRRNQNEQKRLIREHFEGEGWRTGDLLEEMIHCDDFYFDKLSQVRMESWTKGRMALVGDASYRPAFQEYDQSFRPVPEGFRRM